MLKIGKKWVEARKKGKNSTFQEDIMGAFQDEKRLWENVSSFFSRKNIKN